MLDDPLVTTLLDATTALDEAGIPHALVGGMAAILYGSTRTTRDADFSVRAPAANVVAALSNGSFGDVVLRGSVVQGRHGAIGFRVDAMLSSGEFEDRLIDDARERRIPGGAKVRTALLEDVIAFKLIGGRPRDLRDIEELVELNSELRWQRVIEMLALVGVSASAEELLRAAAADDLRPVLKALARSVRDT